MPQSITRVLVVAAAVVCCSGVAAAQSWPEHRRHFTTGISFNPDQFQAGVQVPIGARLKPQIRPGIELGFGNGVRLLALSGDVLYHRGGTRWHPYAGGGPGLNFIDVSDGVGEGDGLTAKLVAHAVTGLGWTPGRSRRRYFVEGRFGFGDTPDVRISLGTSF